MTTTLQILSFLSFAAAVCCYSIKELQAHGKLKWSKDYNGFWDDEDCVIQYHPPKSEYVNNHPNVLHLWRSTTQNIPLPDSILVGIKPVMKIKNRKE